MASELKSPIEELHQRPGFLIRRAQQIAVSLFLEETGPLGITNTQYGILLVLKNRPGIDQITLAKLLGLDRSTTGMVLGKLEKAGLIGRQVEKDDRRRRTLALTTAGARMLDSLAEPARRAQKRVLSAFNTEEQTAFLRLLDKFVGKFNGSTRVPIDAQRVNGERAKGRTRRTVRVKSMQSKGQSVK